MPDNPLVETADQFYNNIEDSEPTKPTDSADVTIQEEQQPEQDVEKVDNPVEDKTETEESEAESEQKESLFIELDGKEIDLDDVKKWRDGHLMQKDYTKKTTDLAEERKTFNAERESERETLQQEKAKINEMRDTLQVLMSEDEAIDWAELKADDPDRYIELKELNDKRKEALAKIQADREAPKDDPAFIQAEQEKLYKANPGWLDENGKTTDLFNKDIDLMNSYVSKAGFSNEEFSQLTQAHYLTTILKAAKYDSLQEKGREIKEKREKVPIVTKPKASKITTQPESDADLFYGKKAG